MKKHSLFLALALFAMVFLFSCNHDDDKPANPISQLPAATQTGAGTFGCLLDGEVFLPGPGLNTLDCVYQLVDGDYYFSLQANKRDSNYNLIALGCNTQKFEIAEGQTYSLKEKADGNVYGRYYYYIDSTFTSSVNSGELKITKLDFTNFIVSGTFWYDILDTQGNLHHIREGRFDMHFTT